MCNRFLPQYHLVLGDDEAEDRFMINYNRTVLLAASSEGKLPNSLQSFPVVQPLGPTGCFTGNCFLMDQLIDV